MPTKIENVFGWFGAVILLLAYITNILGYIKADSLLYVLLNIIGGVLVAYIAYRYTNFQSALINVVWVVIGLIALFKIF